MFDRSALLNRFPISNNSYSGLLSPNGFNRGNYSSLINQPYLAQLVQPNAHVMPRYNIPQAQSQSAPTLPSWYYNASPTGFGGAFKSFLDQVLKSKGMI